MDQLFLYKGWKYILFQVFTKNLHNSLYAQKKKKWLCQSTQKEINTTHRTQVKESRASLITNVSLLTCVLCVQNTKASLTREKLVLHSFQCTRVYPWKCQQNQNWGCWRSPTSDHGELTGGFFLNKERMKSINSSSQGTCSGPRMVDPNSSSAISNSTRKIGWFK